MIQAFIMKKVAGAIVKKVMEKRQIQKMKKYVEEDNELDIQMKQAHKTTNKQGKYIEELEKKIAILEKDSHPSQEYICCMKCGCKISKTKLKKEK
jgi:hypothetical protein